MPGMIFVSKSAKMRSSGSASRGGDEGSDARISPGLTCDNTGYCSGCSRYSAIQSSTERPCSTSSSLDRSPLTGHLHSSPAKDLECDRKADDQPRSQHRHLRPQRKQRVAAEHVGAQSVIRRGKRERFDERLHRMREILG